MVSDEYKVIFVSIPRTGGHTINSLFQKDKEINPGEVGGRHAKPSDYVNAFPIKWKEYFKFTIVRNPFDRVVSYWSRNNRGYLTQMDLSKKKIWDKVKNDFNTFIQNELAKNLNRTHYIPMIRWFEFPRGYANYDYVCRFEKFQDEIKRVCDKVGKEYPEEISKTFGAPRIGSYKEYYTEESIAIVKKLYAEDLRKFKYDF